jgi:hypothetical protein
MHLAASAAVLPSFSLAYAAPGSRSQGPTSKPQPSVPPPISPKDVTITASSEFMQDYITAHPVLETQGLEETYVARDGTLNIYSPVGFNEPQAKPSIDRLHRTNESPTGWAIERHTLLPDDPDAPPTPANGPPICSRPWSSRQAAARQQAQPADLPPVQHSNCGAGSNEYHVCAGQMIAERICCRFGRCTPHFWLRAGAKALG